MTGKKDVKKVGQKGKRTWLDREKNQEGCEEVGLERLEERMENLKGLSHEK